MHCPDVVKKYFIFLGPALSTKTAIQLNLENIMVLIIIYSMDITQRP